ncbi:MAG TPA: tripartite tricarboxylate transporter substrate binding protein [Xanthobacteraceae bacterium]|jgi:tripartite-type tricarboxylate transporter receptor subunit TctC|nr:tripartite tricarboxylate transporter substrate binding protein [Xanthobacteraceae bacterium]
MRHFLAGLAALMLLLCVQIGGRASAQETDYPARPVKVVVPYPAGGLVDLITRVATERMAASLGQQFVIESRAGANGTIATASVAHAEPDGYTLLMITDSHAVNPLFYKNLSYDSVKDFAPIGLIGKSPMVLTVHVSVPARTVKELIALARADPGSLSYGSIGLGSASHLAGEMFKLRAGVDMLHVPYRGGAPAVNDLIAGHLKTMFLTPVSGLPHIQAGKLAPLAIAAPARFELMPDVPTMAEAGVPLEAAYWVGMVAPAATPPAVIAKLEKALSEATAAADVRGRLTQMGAVVTPLGPAAFGDFIRADLKAWADFVAESRIKVE